MELKIKDVEKFMFFPTVICTPQYDRWFRSYGLSNSEISVLNKNGAF
jgi:hypothetical protein